MLILFIASAVSSASSKPSWLKNGQLSSCEAHLLESGTQDLQQFEFVSA